MVQEILNVLFREDVHVYSSPIYGCSVKWSQTNNEIGGNIPGGNFLGENFSGSNFPGGGGAWWVRIFRVGISLGEIFLEPIQT